MTNLHFNPYRTPQEVAEIITHIHQGEEHLVHPQVVLQELRQHRSAVGRFNGWLADHIVGLAGMMAFFYLLCGLMLGWGLWQGVADHNHGFDPYPFSFLFFILGGIMQSLFVPTMLTASNRSAQRDRIKDEADHRAWSHLYDVNDEQLQILHRVAAWLDEEPAANPKDTAASGS